jgi:hypothetical protein
MAGDNGNQDNLALLYGGMDPNNPGLNFGLPGVPPLGAGPSPTVAPGGAASTMPVAPGAAGPGPSAVPPNGAMARPSPLSQVTLPTPPAPPTMTPIPQMSPDLKQKLVTAQTPTDRSQYKPHWYERLEGGLIGAGIGFHDPARGAEIGGDFTNRRYERAESARQGQLAPLLEQQRQYEESLGPIEKGNEEATKGYQVQSQNYDNLDD